jgi:hypothetical protein
MERPKHFDTPYLRNSGGLDREGGGKLFAEMLRQRQAEMFGGRHPTLGGMRGLGSPFPGAHPMMGGYSPRGFPPPMGPPPMGMVGMMGMWQGGMFGGRHPALGGMGVRGTPLPGAQPMMDGYPQYGFPPPMGPPPMGMMGLGHSPFGQRRSPFGIPSAGPPRAHLFLPQQRPSHSPFARQRPSPFASRMMFDDFDDYDYDYDYDPRMPPRRGFGQPMRSSFRFAPERQHPRRRSYHPPPSMFEYEESDDDYDDYDDNEDDFEDEDELEDYIPRRSPYIRLRGY